MPYTTTEHLNWVKTGSIGEALLSYAMLKIGPEKTKETVTAGLWKDTVDETWKIVCNGTPNKLEEIPPYSWTIEFNGWPAGLLSVITGEGVICAGELGNVENLQKALFESISLYLKNNNGN